MFLFSKNFFGLLTTTLLLSCTIRAEYLLFEQRDGVIVPVGPETPGADAAFLAIMKYQFPANTNPAHSITAEERAALDDNEQAFIQKKVQEVNPNFAIMFIPSVLYELFCIRRYLEKPAREWLRYLIFLIRTNDFNETFDGAKILDQFKEIIAYAPDEDVRPSSGTISKELASSQDSVTKECASLQRTRILEAARIMIKRIKSIIILNLKNFCWNREAKTRHLRKN